MALSFYRQIVDHYYSQYGIEVTPRIKEIYQFILDRMPSDPIDVSELENTLMKDEDADKTFYCDFDVFKNIYQVNLRSVRRSMKARVLVLLTLVDTSNELTNSSIQEESAILKQVISSSLRKNDIFSKFNVSQYSLIVASPHLEGAKKAVERIEERYQAKKKHQTMILQTELKTID